MAMLMRLKVAIYGFHSFDPVYIKYINTHLSTSANPPNKTRSSWTLNEHKRWTPLRHTVAGRSHESHRPSISLHARIPNESTLIACSFSPSLTWHTEDNSHLICVWYFREGNTIYIQSFHLLSPFSQHVHSRPIALQHAHGKKPRITHQNCRISLIYILTIRLGSESWTLRQHTHIHRSTHQGNQTTFYTYTFITMHTIYFYIHPYIFGLLLRPFY